MKLKKILNLLKRKKILNYDEIKNIPTGVLTGNEAHQLFLIAKKQGYAIPAINITNTNIINTVLETAKQVNSPIIIQISNGGAHFFAGKTLNNEKQEASIIGAISAAKHVHELAKTYNVRVILHTDHAAKKLLPWIDGLLKASEKEYNTTGRALFTSHMLDLSQEPLQENIETSTKYFKKMNELGIMLEVEIGMTGGEEDGVDNSEVENEKLYTSPEDVNKMYEALKEISPNFTIAASFGNVHGVYRPENLKLHPKILNDSQKHVQEINKTKEKPINFVFHGGSGSPKDSIKEAITYGTIKFNIDTDAQWAFWEGVKKYYEKNKEYLQTEIGNPQGENTPNKKYYDPRQWLRAGEENLKQKIIEYYETLNATNRNN